MDSKGTQPYIYMHPFSPQTPLPSKLPHNMSRVPCDCIALFNTEDPKSFLVLFMLVFVMCLKQTNNYACVCLCVNCFCDKISCFSFHRKILFTIYRWVHSTQNSFIKKERCGKLSQLTRSEGCQMGQRSFSCLKAVKIGLIFTIPVMQGLVGESCGLIQQVLVSTGANF